MDYAAIKPARENLTASVDFLSHQETEEDDRRKFHMVAYTGATVSRLYGAAVFDLEGIQHGEQVPILFNHDETRIAGYGDTFEFTERGLEISGYLSKATMEGRQVAALSDEGLKWQASVGLAVSEWEELQAKQSADVNGTKLSGPLSVGRKSRLLEVSFVTAGADHLTSAVALAAKEQSMQCQQCAELGATDTTDETPTEDLAAKVAALEEALSAERERVSRLEAAEAERTETLAQLEAESRHPGVGFDGAAREDLSPAKPKTPDEAWEQSASLRAEFFHHKPAFEAFVRREGWKAEE